MVTHGTMERTFARGMRPLLLPPHPQARQSPLAASQNSGGTASRAVCRTAVLLSRLRLPKDRLARRLGTGTRRRAAAFLRVLLLLSLPAEITRTGIREANAASRLLPPRLPSRQTSAAMANSGGHRVAAVCPTVDFLRLPARPLDPLAHLPGTGTVSRDAAFPAIPTLHPRLAERARNGKMVASAVFRASLTLLSRLISRCPSPSVTLSTELHRRHLRRK